MAIPNYLKKPIYIAYAIGSNSNGQVEYDEPFIIYAQTTDVKSLVLREDVGVVPDYDRMILVPYGNLTQFIDEQTLLWVDVEPNAKRTNMDYKVERVGDVIDNNIILYCNSLTTNTKPLYYEFKGKIYQVKVDINNLVAIVPLNKFLPIKEDTKVWLTKPVSIDSTKNLIRLINKEKSLKSCKLTFEMVQ